MAEEKQIQHAERIRVERVMGELFQAPRQTIRKALNEAARASRVVSQQPTATIQQGTPVQGTTSTQHQPAQPISVESARTGGAGSGGAGSAIPPLHTVIGNISGTLYYIQIPMIVGAAV